TKSERGRLSALGDTGGLGALQPLPTTAAATHANPDHNVVLVLRAARGVKSTPKVIFTFNCLMYKLLAANRSEIAIRCFRAATERGLRTVAVYSYEDRFSLHRFKADEAFQIGPVVGGEPVRSYLNIEAILAIARQSGVDAIHPGYGFLAENGDF